MDFEKFVKKPKPLNLIFWCSVGRQFMIRTIHLLYMAKIGSDIKFLVLILHGFWEIFEKVKKIQIHLEPLDVLIYSCGNRDFDKIGMCFTCVSFAYVKDSHVIYICENKITNDSLGFLFSYIYGCAIEKFRVGD